MKALRGHGFSRERFFPVSEVPNALRWGLGVVTKGKIYADVFKYLSVIQCKT
ncbi:9417_t:CDS:2 [Funneliformis mosseae]|uniref:9417_t:CDS:1 n=1 Tax=Funneliformis mosseae TaxID=27381 RepID=A0A9N9DLX2_FUNMO|nr:9417_t:CDS:2 [Funneliformis mosseae]